ncbi:hypothetical protein BJ742DRAFT_748173 [Cladochytrium replicatum]|nr:hypothetical protein BJ742DRAFT_748173 [Cladochytrium replicatum]
MDRVYRVQRDIPMLLIPAGVEHGNLCEFALNKMKDLGTECRDVRTREYPECRHPDILAYEDPKQCSIERELHVYGNVVRIHNRNPTKFQHQEHGPVKMAVISAQIHCCRCRDKNYYRKLVYELEGTSTATFLRA